MDEELVDEVESAMSLYEDALEEGAGEDDDLRQLLRQSTRHLRAQERSKRPKPVVAAAPSSSSQSSPSRNKKHSSSSEHSSIEKLPMEAGPSSIRSRRGTASQREMRRKGQKSGSSHSNDGSPELDDWKAMNFAELHSTYPVLLQLNQQLQFLSRQIYEMESTNALQLKLIHRVASSLLQMKRRPWISWDRFWRALPLFFLLFAWPFLANFLWRWYMARRHKLALNFFKYF